VAESGAPTEAEGSFDKLQLRPKTISALSKMSRLMLLQSTPAIELLARKDLMAVLGLGVDLAALSGSGASNQPTGIVNQAGVGVVIMGTNGANVTLDTLTALETAANISNAPVEGRAYVINPKTVNTLKNLKSSTGQYLWTDNAPGQRSATPHSFNGYPVYVTNQVRSNLVKGASGAVCSELFLGAWQDLVIGQWGTVEVLVNPYDSTGFTTGDVFIRAMQTVDIGVRHAASFVYCSDALTP
jgi:HK97 family phage major capsid protein